MAPALGMETDGAHGLIHLAAIAELEGDAAQAERLWAQSRTQFANAEDKRSLGIWEYERGCVKEQLNDLDSAERHYHNWLHIVYGLGLEQHASQALGRLAHIALMRRNERLAGVYLSAAERLSQTAPADKTIREVAQALRAATGEDSYRSILLEGGEIDIATVITGGASCAAMAR
jgi:hypothetical protein